MFRVILTSVLAASASRVTIQEHDNTVKTDIKFGASCETLQTRFHNGVVAFQAALDANPNEGAMSAAAQARLSMRVYGVVRNLRRARDCDWVINTANPDVEALQAIVQRLLVNNPCAAQANAELQEGADELSTLWRSTSILMSDTCEAADFSSDGQQDDANIDAVLEDELSTGESQLQDNIEELIVSEDNGSAFIQSEGAVSNFFRGLGVAFVFILLLLLCTSVAVIIGFLIPAILFLVAAAIFPPLAPGCGPCLLGTALPRAIQLGLGGAAIAGVTGIVTCARQVNGLWLPGPN